MPSLRSVDILRPSSFRATSKGTAHWPMEELRALSCIASSSLTLSGHRNGRGNLSYKVELHWSWEQNLLGPKTKLPADTGAYGGIPHPAHHGDRGCLCLQPGFANSL